MYRAGRIYNSINIIYIIYVRSPTQNVAPNKVDKMNHTISNSYVHA